MLSILILASGCAWYLLPPVPHHQGNRLNTLPLSPRRSNEHHDLVRGLAVTDGRTRAGLSIIERESGAERTQCRDGIFGTRLGFCVTLEL